MCAAFLHPVEEHVPMAAALLVACFVLCFLLAEVAERRKKFFASLIVSLLPVLSRTGQKTRVNIASDTASSGDTAPATSQLIRVLEEMQNALDGEEKVGGVHDVQPSDRASRA
jgi:hypothetical protein